MNTTSLKLLASKSSIGFSSTTDKVWSILQDFGSVYIDVRSNSFVGTLSVYATMKYNEWTPVDYSLPASPSNPYIILNVVNQATGTASSTITPTAPVWYYQVLMQEISGIAVVPTAYTSGSVDVYIHISQWEGRNTNTAGSSGWGTTTGTIWAQYIDALSGRIVEQVKVVDASGVTTSLIYRYLDTGALYGGSTANLSLSTPTSGTPTSPNLSTTLSIITWGVAQTILVANPTRKGFEFQNNSASDLRLAFWVTASAIQGFIMKPDSSYTTPSNVVPTAFISLYGTTTGQQYSVIEY